MRRRLAFAALAAVLAAGCAAPLPRGRWNVLVVVVDTLRADRTGAYGYERPTTPHLDALAAESFLFTGARAQASCTFPSVNSLLTSRYPAAFHGQEGGAMGIPAGIPSLPERLAARGWTTAAVSASPIVRATPSRHNPSAGYGRGFQSFDETCEWQPGVCVTDAALAAIDRLREPFLLYAHYLDPHGRYNPPEPWRSRFRRGESVLPWALRGDPNPIGDMLYKKGPKVAYGPGDVEVLSSLYDGEVAYADAEVARLLDAVRSRALLDRTVVAVLADHGESFLEHGHVKHCRSLYDVEIKTPFLLRLPGQAEGRRIAGPVQNLDLVPTLLDLLGLSVEDEELEGRSLVPQLRGEPLSDGFAFATSGALRSVADERFKLIHDLRRGSWELYDLAADPGERRDVLREHRREFARLREALLAWVARSEGPRGLERAEAAEERLRALGYL